jgi:hypothetical protein
MLKTNKKRITMKKTITKTVLLLALVLCTGARYAQVVANGTCGASLTWELTGTAPNLTLTSITIPNSVTGIGSDAFSGCTGLKEVVVQWDTPLVITADVFDGVTLGGVMLRVPAGREAAYRQANVWKDFGIITTGNTGVEEQAVHIRYAEGVLSVNTPSSEQVYVYSVNGSLLFHTRKAAGPEAFSVSLPKGVWIVRGSSGWVRKSVY